MTFLMIAFILLVYPVNFGIGTAPSIQKLLSLNAQRSSFLINMIFLLTFVFPLVPVIKKWEELIIPLLTHWLAENIGEYLDKLYHREGFQILIFKAVVLIMQSPVIFIFGIYLGKQIT